MANSTTETALAEHTSTFVLIDRAKAEARVASASTQKGPHSYAARQNANGEMAQALRHDGAALADHLAQAAVREGRGGDGWSPDLYDALQLAAEQARLAENPLDFVRYLLITRAHGALEALQHLGGGVAALATRNHDADADALLALMKGEVEAAKVPPLPVGWPTPPQI